MQQPDSTSARSARGLVIGSAVIITLYVISLFMGWPQEFTRRIVAGLDHGHTAAPDATSPADPAAPADHAAPAAGHGAVSAPPAYTVIPFVLLLGAIAVFPLLRWTHHWWESNLHRFYVAAALAALTIGYYFFFHPTPIDGHYPAHHTSEFSPGESMHWGTLRDLLANALLGEYVPFIVLLLSLYTISGGIRIEGDLPAHPTTNTAFIGAGALLASFVGTTGAAMLLIRPLLETNRERKHVAHTIIIFIFAVCNCGGCLLPIGDPPLFLGYLQGVPFLWTFNLWKAWLFVNGSLLALYWIWDAFVYKRETLKDIQRDETRRHRLRFSGFWLNGLMLLGVILAVALLDPSKKFPGTDWHPWIHLREMVQLGLICLSLLFGSAAARRANRFNFAAIVEVAVLFLGIFICMQPALQILNAHGEKLGLDSPTKFFWATGSLSSFLDNAPTYLVFFQTANALTLEPGEGILKLTSGHFIREDLLIAVSLGAVFMGAMTYIGNGPNFMVKAIAESSGIKMPSFFGYMLYSCAILLPLFALVNLLFL